MATDTVQRTLNEDIFLDMWVGDKNALESLLATCRSLEKISQDEVRAAFDASFAQRHARFYERTYLPYDATDEENEAAWLASNDAELSRVLEKVSVRMEITLKSYGEVLSGRPENVLAELTRPAEVAAVQFTLGEQRPYNVMRHSGFKIVINADTVRINIYGGHTMWMDTAKAQLTAELKRQQPWYYKARAVWGICLLLVFPIAALMVSLLLYLVDDVLTDWWIYIVVFVPVTTAEVLIVRSWSKFFPTFELHPAGKDSRSRTVIAWISGAALWIAGSLVVPVVLG